MDGKDKVVFRVERATLQKFRAICALDGETVAGKLRRIVHKKVKESTQQDTQKRGPGRPPNEADEELDDLILDAVEDIGHQVGVYAIADKIGISRPKTEKAAARLGREGRVQVVKDGVYAPLEWVKPTFG